MIDFSAVTAVTIPEGAVKKITVAGEVIWEKSSSPWDAVFAAIKDGTYKEKFAIGYQLPLDLGEEGLLTMEIAAFDCDPLSDGSGTAPITWVAKELLATSYRMNPARSGSSGAYREGSGCIGGWAECLLRSWLSDSILPLIPEPVRSHMVSVTKSQMSCNSAAKLHGQTCSDLLWIPSKEECYDSDGAYRGLFPDAASRIKMKAGASDALVWWNRTAVNSTGFAFGTFTATGASGTRYAQYSNGVCIGFCVK